MEPRVDKGSGRHTAKENGMPSTDIDPALFLKVRPVLDHHERLLWVGRPNADRVAMENQELLLCGLILTALGLTGVPGMGVTTSTLILFGPFVLAGLFLLWTPARRVNQSSRTLYAITRERLIILRSDSGRCVQSLAPGDLGEIECVEQSGGSGDLIIALRAYRDGLTTPPDRIVRLSGITQVRDVQALLHSTFRTPEEQEQEDTRSRNHEG